MEWFSIIKWLSEQEDATTVAELQHRLELVIKYIKFQDNCIWIVIWLIFIVLLFNAFYMEHRLKKLEKALSEKSLN